MRFITILMLIVIISLSSCASKSPKVEVTIDQNTFEPTSERVSMTRQHCQAIGGIEVGDIGDGRIHHPDYLCANSRQPLGVIKAELSAPRAIEGSVCCGTDVP
jgi:hypothetical protein